jgi:hypothetical protein
MSARNGAVADRNVDRRELPRRSRGQAASPEWDTRIANVGMSRLVSGRTTAHVGMRASGRPDNK